MHLCVTFGEPSPRKMLARLKQSEFNMWREYASMFGLPSEIPSLIARYFAGQASSKTKRVKSTDFLVFARKEKQPKLRHTLSQHMQMIGNVIKARNGSS